MIALILGCPLHPTYRAHVAPGGMHGSATCKGCKKLFAVRNNTHAVMSTPREERRDLDDVLIVGVEEHTARPRGPGRPAS